MSQAPSPFDPDAFVAGQRNTWNEVASGWEQWDHWFDIRFAPLNAAIVTASGAKPGDHALDLGSGTGYPAVNVAEAVGPAGSVHGLDLAADMLVIARKKAAARGYGHVTFAECDVRSIPQQDARFDVITSRFCLMFLPDPKSTMGEIHRTLKPGGAFAGAVWGAPHKNPGFATPQKIIGAFFDVPPPPANSPGVFSLSDVALLSGMIEGAGFADVTVEESPVTFTYDSLDHFMSSIYDLSAPVRGHLAGATEETLQALENEVAAAIEQYKDGKGYVFPATPLLFRGVKPEA
jgi:SAM-dependent methyltransferase